MTTMRDVAALAGVSAKTVSRVFNDDPHVLPETRARVEEALRSAKYLPNTIAQTFRAGRASAVGIAVPSIADPFFASIVAAVDEEVKQYNLSTVVTSLGDDVRQEAPLVEALLRRQLSGLIVTPIATDQRYLAQWLPRVPTVFVDRPATGIAADCFIEDDVAGAELATRHLIAHGSRRIAFLGDNLHVSTTIGRISGYRRALADHGIEDDAALQFDASDAATVLPRFEAFLQAVRPDAVFPSNARISIELMPILMRGGLPYVGFGDFSMADMLTPAVTVIDQNPAELGRLAALRLLERIAHPGRRLRRRNVLPVRLIERESCRVGRPAVSVLSA